MKIVIAVIVGILGLAFGIMWLLTKGLIWVMFTLFNINWYQNFWAVFVLLIIVSSIFNSRDYRGMK